jgi:hypothetical protein
MTGIFASSREKQLYKTHLIDNTGRGVANVNIVVNVNE